MKEVNKIGAQGDVLFRRVDKLPVGAKRVDRAAGPIVVAHSETGHHHAIEHDPHVEVWSGDDALTTYLRMDGGFSGGCVDVVHHRPCDTHETLRLLSQPGDVWQVRRQREHTPEGWRRVED